VGTLRIGLTEPATNPERTGTLEDSLEGVLDSDAGHGTFIAGLIRQTCPDANILAIRVMYGDGAVAEGDLLKALNRLTIRQAIAQDRNRPELLVDVLSLSLGYYHELPSDAAYDHMILEPLLELGRRGVAVVAAAGNDSTTRHMYPAGFTPHEGGLIPKPNRNAVPVVSVGALNPNGTTIALFSNAGSWVTCRRGGAALVSTMPLTFNGALQPIADVHVPGDGERGTIDPDDFRGGFATWSGTSFSAPILAGEIAQHLFDSKSLDAIDAPSSVARAWQAIRRFTPLRRG
jgi:subtilisin family serine protease